MDRFAQITDRVAATTLPIGLCFQYAYQFWRKNGGVIVHGTVHDPWDGHPFAHGWVEKGGKVYDWQNMEMRKVGPKPIAEFYDVWKPVRMTRFEDSEEILLSFARSRHYGPWPPFSKSIKGQDRSASFGLAIGDVLYSAVKGAVNFYEVVQSLDYKAVVRQIENRMFGKMFMPMTGHYVSGPMSVPVLPGNEVRISVGEYAMPWDGHTVTASRTRAAGASPEVIRDFVNGWDVGFTFSTKEIAQEWGCSTNTAYRILCDLEREQYVCKQGYETESGFQDVGFSSKHTQSLSWARWTDGTGNKPLKVMANSRRPQVNTREASISERVAAFTMSRDFYIPKNAPNLQEFKHPEVDLVFYTYGDEVTGIHGLAFQGKANKPLWHYRFRNVQQRDAKIEETVSSRKSHHETIDQRRQERREYKHGLQVGDILVSKWGYDQTNADWYQVVEVGDRSVKIRPIAGNQVDDDHEVAMPNKFTGPVMTKIVGVGDHIRITSFSSASKWDGRPTYVTPFGMGH